MSWLELVSALGVVARRSARFLPPNAFAWDILPAADSASNGQEAVSYANCDRLKSFNNQDAAGKLLRAYDTGNNRWRLELQDELDDVYLPL